MEVQRRPLVIAFWTTLSGLVLSAVLVFANPEPVRQRLLAGNNAPSPRGAEGGEPRVNSIEASSSRCCALSTRVPQPSAPGALEPAQHPSVVPTEADLANVTARIDAEITGLRREIERLAEANLSRQLQLLQRRQQELTKLQSDETFQRLIALMEELMQQQESSAERQLTSVGPSLGPVPDLDRGLRIEPGRRIEPAPKTPVAPSVVRVFLPGVDGEPLPIRIEIDRMEEVLDLLERSHNCREPDQSQTPSALPSVVPSASSPVAPIDTVHRQAAGESRSSGHRAPDAGTAPARLPMLPAPFSQQTIRPRF